MKNFKVLLGALVVSTLLISSSAHAAFGYVTEIVNQSKFFATVQNTDNGHSNELLISSPCTAGRARANLEIGCTPYAVAPGETLRAKNYVIPWQKYSGIISVAIHTIDQFGDTTKVYFNVQEISGQVVVSGGGTNFTPVKQDRDNSQNSNWRLRITAAKEVVMEKIS